MKILHISDLHFKEEAEDDKATAERIFNEFLDYLVEIANVKPFDYIFITGDIADAEKNGDISDAGKNDIYREAKTHIAKLLKKLEMEKKQVFICPGNHDLIRDRLNDIDIPKTYEMANEILKVEKIKELLPNFETYSKSCEDMGFCKFKIGRPGNECDNYLTGHTQTDDLNIVCINTAWFAKHKDNRDLWVGKELVEYINNQINADLMTITICHHTTDFWHEHEKSTYKGPSSCDLINKFSTMVLFGHTHESISHHFTTHENTSHCVVGAGFSKGIMRNFGVYELDVNHKLVKTITEHRWDTQNWHAEKTWENPVYSLKLRDNSESENNLFSDAFKALQADNTPKNIFRDYHYKYCLTPFMGRDRAMQDLDDFMEDERKFLWHVVYGEAGAGKSRLALELCKKYKYKADEKWDCGFIGWPEFSTEITDWENWRPKCPTLIVVDYAKKYLRSKQYVGDVTQETSTNNTLFPRIISCLEILMRNVEVFKYPVRFLFLERGKKKRKEDTAVSLSMEPFHEQLMDENNNLSTILYPVCYALENPLFLQGLDSDEALQTLAESIVEGDWPPYCRSQQFLEQLEKFDDKKRPLFAIILAHMLRTSDTEVSKEKILQAVIKDAFKPSKYPGLCREDLYLLMLATMCGGLHSLPDMAVATGVSNISLPNVWNNDDIREKYFDWGFAEETVDKDGSEGCIVLPLEPDLLGEFFVLEGFRHVKTSTGAGIMPRNILQNVAHVACHEAVEKAPEKLSSFFLRCSQDFPNNEQLKNVVIFLLKLFSEIYDDTLKHRICLDWARLAANLVDHYVGTKKRGNAQNIFDAMANLGEHQDIVMLRGRASLNLLMAYCIADNLEKAENIFEGMIDLSNHPYNDFWLTHASSALIRAYIRAGDLEKAEKVFEPIADIDDRDDQKGLYTERAAAAFDLINAYASAGNLEKNEKIIETIGRMGDLPDHTVLRTKAYAHLIDAYGKAGDLKKAKTKYDAMSGMVGDMGFHGSVVLKDRAEASFNLIRYYIKAGTLDDIAEAQNIYDAMIKLVDLMGITKLYAWAAIHLQYAYVKDYPPDNIEKIHEIYDTMTSNLHFLEFMFPIEPDISLEISERAALAKLCPWLVIITQYDSVKDYTPDNMEKLKKIYDTRASTLI